MLPLAEIEEVEVLKRSNHRENDQQHQEERPGEFPDSVGQLGEFVLDENSEEEGKDEHGQGDGELGVGNGDTLAHHGGSQEEDPHGGEGEGAQRGDEGHRAGEIHIAVKHRRLPSTF